MKSILKRALSGTYALTASGFAAAQATDNAAAPAADPNSAAAPAPDSSAAPESSTPGSERAAPHDRFMQEVVVTAQKHEQDKLISGEEAFKLHDTYGFPVELTIEEAERKLFRGDIKVMGWLAMVAVGLLYLKRM